MLSNRKWVKGHLGAKPWTFSNIWCKSSCLMKKHVSHTLLVQGRNLLDDHQQQHLAPAAGNWMRHAYGLQRCCPVQIQHCLSRVPKFQCTRTFLAGHHWNFGAALNCAASTFSSPHPRVIVVVHFPFVARERKFVYLTAAELSFPVQGLRHVGSAHLPSRWCCSLIEHLSLTGSK